MIILKSYFQDIFNTTRSGNVREESYYPDLKKLFDSWARYHKKAYFVTPLPRKTEAGNPDFRILTPNKQLVGYIEAKATTIEDLESVEDSEQLRRYRDTFPNLILTNFFEFRLYRNGELIDKVAIGRPFIIHKLQMVPPAENENKFLDLLNKFFAFSIPRTTTAKALAIELMMASYAIGHLKIGFILDEFGYKLSDEERFNLYLTNTLDFTKENPNAFPGIFEQTISKESQDALKVKEEIPIMAVMGNPPYSVSSTNIIKEGSEFHKFYESYKELVRKEERNIQPLSDDYIKFIAFAHWKIKQTGQGVIGMITNNSYLDGLIHRDMRKKLLDDFDEIYILNLHGNSKRREKTPIGGKDENVFDIQQGVSIVLMLKMM